MEMKILVVNAGSSSLKFQLFRCAGNEPVARGHYDGIGRSGTEAGCIRKLTVNSMERKQSCSIGDHGGAIRDMLDALQETGIVRDRSEIVAAGHRVVHGGERYSATTRIDRNDISALKELSHLAPLHNPINIACVEVLLDELPEARQYAVFDTAFHQTMPREVFLYGLPLDLYEKFGIRKYGFHGTSHRYVAGRAAELLGRDTSDLNLITCHLGNGQSICAVRHGKSFNTSMGFTPLEGLPMGTRSGSFDPEIVLFLLDHGFSSGDIKDIINKRSGLMGLSGLSSDHRIIEEKAAAGDERAALADRLIIHRITGLIGSYAAEMGGVDAIVFTGGIGEHSSRLRRSVLSNFRFMGLEIDEGLNDRHEPVITTPGSAVAVLVIPTDEELQIALEVRRAMSNEGL
jgi:acetate kinase